LKCTTQKRVPKLVESGWIEEGELEDKREADFAISIETQGNKVYGNFVGEERERKRLFFL
jgi:hypothetical protein